MRYNLQEIDSLPLQQEMFNAQMYEFIPIEPDVNEKKRKRFPVNTLPEKYQTRLRIHRRVAVPHKQCIGGIVRPMGIKGYIQRCDSFC